MLRKKTDIALALDYLGRVTRKKATVFLVSDFVAEGYIRPLSLVNRRHDVIAVAVQDPAEAAMPSVGLVEFADAETGEVALVDTSSRAFRRRFAEASARRLDVLESQFASINVDCIQVRTDRPYIHDLVRFFHKRHRRY